MNPIFQSVNTHYVRYGTESLTSLANKIWSLVIPAEIQNSETLQIFQKKIKLWQTDDCPCRLCKVYTSQLGFI